MVDYLGFLAGFTTTVSFLPQVIKVYRTKSGEDISFWMVLLLSCGTFLWLVYGLILHSLPIVIANALTLALAMTILVTKIATDYRRRPR